MVFTFSARILPSFVERQRRLGHMIAAMGVGQEGFAAFGGPFHRPAHALGRPQADGLFGIDEDLGAEAAADIGRDHAQFVLGRDLHEGREHQPRHMRVLAGGRQREDAAAGIVFADRRARLHRIGDQPVVDEVEFDHVRGLGEGGFGRRFVAQFPFIDRVARRLVVNLRRARLLRIFHGHDGRQFLVIDHDLLGALFGGGRASRR